MNIKPAVCESGPPRGFSFGIRQIFRWSIVCPHCAAPIYYPTKPYWLSVSVPLALSVLFWVFARRYGLVIEWWILGHVAIFVAHILVMPAFLNYQHALDAEDNAVWGTAVGIIRFLVFFVLLVMY